MMVWGEAASQGDSRPGGTLLRHDQNVNVLLPTTPPHQESLNSEDAWLAGLPEDIAFLHRFGIGLPTLQEASARANRFGISASEALLIGGAMSENAYARCAALELGLEFSDQTPGETQPLPEVPSPDQTDQMARVVQTRAPDGLALLENQFAQRNIHIAPNQGEMSLIKGFLKKYPHIRSRLRVSPFSVNRESVVTRCSRALLDGAIGNLRDLFAEFSAYRVVTVPQALFLLVALQIIGVITFLSSSAVVIGAHVLAGIFYLGCVGLRLFAAKTMPDKLQIQAPFLKDRSDPSNSPVDHQLPVYSIMVALYREAGQVDDLVYAMLQLDWPPERLDIKLICEADDLATIAAVEDALERAQRPWISLVRVPPANPRTKPKALNYALPLCRGELLVVYDAEDRPDPLQLREAYATFLRSDGNLVCLQAPLIPHNFHEGWLSRLFTLEYSALFDGLLPALARRGAPMPLGGTSNHFKRKVLESIGAWDPYNVTEDADLGMRISRAGLMIGTITRPTYEEAPIDLMVWLKQRTRWFKGWYQTWLVHMRHPVSLAKDLGATGTLVFNLVITGMIVSALVHPLLLYFVLLWILRTQELGILYTLSNPLFLFDSFTIIAGYAAFAALCWRTLALRGLRHLRWTLLLLPVYWVLISAAAWRAVWHLVRRPHEWEKTPHRLRRAKRSFG